jgi:hypothetical protein
MPADESTWLLAGLSRSGRSVLASRVWATGSSPPGLSGSLLPGSVLYADQLLILVNGLMRA